MTLVLLTDEAINSMVLPEEGTSGAKRPGPSSSSSPGSSIEGSSWIALFFHSLSPAAHDQEQPAQNPAQDRPADQGQPAQNPQGMEYHLSVLQNLSQRENELADWIVSLRKIDRMRIPGPNQLQHIVEVLQEENGGMDSLPRIIWDLQERGRESPFYASSQSIYNNLRREGITDASIHKEWMGRR